MRATGGPALGFGALAVSILLHAGLLSRIESAWDFSRVQHTRIHNSPDSEILQFQFVEAPPKTHPQKPDDDAARISDRDALNQDARQDRSETDTAPRTEREGASDQLRQQRADGSSAMSAQTPAPASDPSEESKAVADGERSQASVPDVTPPPSETRPQGLTGSDKIDTQEMSRKPSKGARLVGQTSFEATGSGMGEYMKNLKEKIWLQWFPYLVMQFPQDSRGADAVISFTIHKSGEVKMVRVVEQRGTPLFATFCMNAIQRAGNFGRLPDEIVALLGKDELEIKFGFHYR